MSEQETTNPASASQAPAPAAARQYDVALVDPHVPTIEHWPRARVAVPAMSVADLSAEAKQPPPRGESAEQEQKRLAFLIAELERGAAIAAYDELYGLSHTDRPQLRYDVVAAVPGSAAPAEPERWRKHRQDVGLL